MKKERACQYQRSPIERLQKTLHDGSFSGSVCGGGGGDSGRGSTSACGDGDRGGVIRDLYLAETVKLL